MLSIKYEGLSYPTQDFEKKGQWHQELFSKYRTKQVNMFVQRNVLYTLFATNKAKIILNRHISCSCSDTIYNKSRKKIAKRLIFESLPFLYYSTFSGCKDVSRTSSNHKIYFNKNKLASNR